MSGRRNNIRTRPTRNVLSLVQTPIQSRSGLNRLRVSNHNRNIRGRFIRTAQSRNLFHPYTPASSPVLTPISPVRLILRFNNVSSYSPISNSDVSPLSNRGNSIIATPPHRVVSDLQLFGLDDESQVIDDFRLPIPTFDLSSVITSLSNNLFESEYAYEHVRLNNNDLEDFLNLSL